MQLHTLRPTFKKKHKKRIGRGGKRGTYSGRGQKGQRARAGHRIRPTAERELISRLPKLRGVKNKRREKAAVIINVEAISRFAKDGVLTREILMSHGAMKRLRSPVKILSGGEVKSPFVVSGIPVSASAKEKIERAGGKVELENRVTLGKRTKK